MLFNSAIFVAFIALLLPVYGLLRADRAKKALLLVASYAFYAHWDWRYLGLLVLSTVVDYAVGRSLAREERPGRRRGWLIASLVTNLGVLAIFKYGNFLIATLDPLWAAAGWRPPAVPGEIPVGVSFYTFQTLSYTIDVFRRDTEPCRSPLEFAMYVAFFPQLVAGPIVRSTEFLPQVRPLPALRLENVAAGAQRFILGLFKKVVIADNVGLFVDAVFLEPDAYDAVTLWCGAYGFALQIYCDFSAYTDMALGIGRAFGLKLPENFDGPYLARSITEFWRRWHMSLSSWLRDYLYIPLGGSRHGALNTYRNLALTMLLGGLWHGAAWTFVLWGGFHGALLAIERLLGVRARTDARWTGRDGLRVLLTLHLVCLAWVMFRCTDFETMRMYLRGMLLSWGEGETLPGVAGPWAAALAALMLGQLALRLGALRERVWERLPAFAQGLALAGLVLGVAAWHVDEVAFIYFQF